MTEILNDVKVQWIEVNSEEAGQRIDNFLFSRLKGVPKSHIYRILRTGEVRRNGGRIQAQERLDPGDVIRVPPLRLATHHSPPLPHHLIRARLESRLLYEDDDLLVLNKPSGMAVHGGSGLSYGVIEGLREIRPHAHFFELVHRLDRETSGCLLIAKKRSALRSLHEQFRTDAVKKTYLALLSGAWTKTLWIIDAPLKKNTLQSGERLVKVMKDGKPSVTEFRRRCRYAKATLVEARPITGRTHQIRVHAQVLGHPLLGDERYGNEAANQEFRQLGLKRLFLHSLETLFIHPATGKPVRIEAPLDQELQDVLKSIDNDH
jgi:23S rRNA pseudouridine955/2504/2580 synthase